MPRCPACIYPDLCATLQQHICGRIALACIRLLVCSQSLRAFTNHHHKMDCRLSQSVLPSADRSLPACSDYYGDYGNSDDNPFIGRTVSADATVSCPVKDISIQSCQFFDSNPKRVTFSRCAVPYAVDVHTYLEADVVSLDVGNIALMC